MIQAEDSPDGKLSVLGVPIGDGYLDIITTTKQLLAAGCKHIAFENSYGYRAIVKPEHINNETGKLLGNGSFRFAVNPQDHNKQYLLYEDKLEPLELVALEAAMHTRTLGWLRNEFKKAVRAL